MGMNTFAGLLNCLLSFGILFDEYIIQDSAYKDHFAFFFIRQFVDSPTGPNGNP